MLTRTNPNATRLDDDVEHRSISGPDVRAEVHAGPRWAKSSISANGSSVCQHSATSSVGLQYKFLRSADLLYSAEWNEGKIHYVPMIISHIKRSENNPSLIIKMQTQQIKNGNYD